MVLLMNQPTRNASAGVVEEIRALMGRRRVSQKQLGDALGLAQPTMSKRMNGKIAFDLNELDGIAAFFDVSILDLFPRPEGTVDQGNHASRWTVETAAPVAA
jgi:transcriptional regulator with XRE-family HTH domain